MRSRRAAASGPPHLAAALDTGHAVVPPAEVGWRAGHPPLLRTARRLHRHLAMPATKSSCSSPDGRRASSRTDARESHSAPSAESGNALAVLATTATVGLGGSSRHRSRAAVVPAGERPHASGVQTQVVGRRGGDGPSAATCGVLAVAYVRDGVPNCWTATLGPHGPTTPLVQRTFETVNGSSARGLRTAPGWPISASRRGTRSCASRRDDRAPARQLTSTPAPLHRGWTGDDAILFAAKGPRGPGTFAAWTATAPRWTARRRFASRGSTSATRSGTRPAAAPSRALGDHGRLWSVRIPDVPRLDNSAAPRTEKNTLAKRLQRQKAVRIAVEADGTTAATWPSSVVSPTRRPSTVRDSHGALARERRQRRAAGVPRRDQTAARRSPNNTSVSPRIGTNRRSVGGTPAALAGCGSSKASDPAPHQVRRPPRTRT